LAPGFKAHSVHKKCLESVSETLALVFNETGTHYEIPEDRILTWVNSAGETVTNTLPICNLEEELDNVTTVCFGRASVGQTHWSYAQILFLASYASQEVSIRMLQWHDGTEHPYVAYYMNSMNFK
jgi:hypothetical protein